MKTPGQVLKTDYIKPQLNEINTQRYRGVVVRARAEKYMRDVLTSMPELSDEDRLSTECPIDIEEIANASNSLRSCKTPGPDKINAEFYKKFKSKLIPILLQIFFYAYQVDELPTSFSRAHTVLIPKIENPEKLQKVTGYRPITLCNVDYKVFAKVLTNRLQTLT